MKNPVDILEKEIYELRERIVLERQERATQAFSGNLAWLVLLATSVFAGGRATPFESRWTELLFVGLLALGFLIWLSVIIRRKDEAVRRSRDGI